MGAEAPQKMARAGIVPLLWTSLFVLGGCTELLVDDYEYGTIEVMAVVESGSPVEGVRMILHKGGEHLAYGVTDAAGFHSFSYVPFGALGIFATFPAGYTTADAIPWIALEEIEMHRGDVRQVTLELVRCTGRIRVLVEDDEGVPVPGARVDLYESTGVIQQETTNAQGSADFLDAPCGNLGVAIAAPDGFAARPGLGGTYIDGLIVEGGQELQLVFTVTRNS
jgi:hypothetical protein